MTDTSHIRSISLADKPEALELLARLMEAAGLRPEEIERTRRVVVEFDKLAHRGNVYAVLMRK